MLRLLISLDGRNDLMFCTHMSPKKTKSFKMNQSLFIWVCYVCMPVCVCVCVTCFFLVWNLFFLFSAGAASKSKTIHPTYCWLTRQWQQILQMWITVLARMTKYENIESDSSLSFSSPRSPLISSLCYWDGFLSPLWSGPGEWLLSSRLERLETCGRTDRA